MPYYRKEHWFPVTNPRPRPLAGLAALFAALLLFVPFLAVTVSGYHGHGSEEDTVVYIEDDQPTEQGMGHFSGSGVLISPTGYVLTCKHVVFDDYGQPASNIRVTLYQKAGGTTRPVDQGLPAERKDADPSRAYLFEKYKPMLMVHDWALLKVNVNRQLPYAPVRDSQSLAVGQHVTAIGFPPDPMQELGDKPDMRVEQGTVSRLHAENTRCINHSATIDHGNSGGPLFDDAGEVVGINAMGRKGSGGAENWAIPTHVLDQRVRQHASEYRR